MLSKFLALPVLASYYVQAGSAVTVVSDGASQRPEWVTVFMSIALILSALCALFLLISVTVNHFKDKRIQGETDRIRDEIKESLDYGDIYEAIRKNTKAEIKKGLNYGDIYEAIIKEISKEISASCLFGDIYKAIEREIGYSCNHGEIKRTIRKHVKKESSKCLALCQSCANYEAYWGELDYEGCHEEV